MLKKKLNINNVMHTVMILVLIVSVTRGIIALSASAPTRCHIL